MLLTTLRLDPQGKLPMYRQLITLIKEAMQEGNLNSGQKLPSIRSLAKALGVSRITVEIAYSQLLDEGFLISKPKQGYYAADLHDLQGPLPPFGEAKEAALDDGPAVRYNFRSYGVENDSFNMTVWRRYLHNALKQPELLTSYGPYQGEPRLLYTLAKYSDEARDVRCSPQQIVVGAGTQSLLHILCGILEVYNKSLAADKALAGQALALPQPITTIGIQAPGFFQAEQIFRDHHYQIRSFSLAELEDEQARLPGLICINPSNPYQGEAVTAAQRLNLLGRAVQQGALLLEDDYIGEFRYLLRPLPSLQSLDRGENVIYLGSFSRTMLPSLRISYMVLPHSLLPAYRQVGFRYNQTASGMEQLALADFIADGHLNRHIRRLRRIYDLKSQRLRQALAHCFPQGLTVAPYESGLRLLLLAASKESAQSLAGRALGEGVALIPLSETMENKKDPGRPWQQLMLSYAAIPEKDILPAVEALKKAWQPVL